MLIGIERLLIRVRHPRSRADELNELRARLRDAIEQMPDTDERSLARTILDRKRALSDALQDVTACRSCESAGHAYTGGACCGGVTAELFDDNEVAALAQSGTRPSDLTPPAGTEQHLGCAFRGPRGCTLDVAHRPGRCVLYICEILSREIYRGGKLDGVERLIADLQRDMKAFIAIHKARSDRDVLAPLVAALEDHARR